MAFRYDYRNDYKDNSIEQLKRRLSKEQDSLLFWIGTESKWDIKNHSKRVSYIKSRIEKLQIK